MKLLGLSSKKIMLPKASGRIRKEKWYNKNVFPLVPILEVKKANKHNTSGFTFRWLIFKFWTLDSFEFEFSIVATGHWGIGFIGVLPYLRWVVAVPCPEWLAIKLSKLLDRKPNNA